MCTSWICCTWHCKADACGYLQYISGGKLDNTEVVSCHPQAALPRSTSACRKICGMSAPQPFYGFVTDNSCSGGSGPDLCRPHRGKSWRKFCMRSSHPHQLLLLWLQFILALQAQDAIQGHGDHLGQKFLDRFVIRTPAASHFISLHLQTLQALPLSLSMRLQQLRSWKSSC